METQRTIWTLLQLALLTLKCWWLLYALENGYQDDRSIVKMIISHPSTHQVEVEYDREQLFFFFFHCEVMDLHAPEEALKNVFYLQAMTSNTVYILSSIILD